MNIGREIGGISIRSDNSPLPLANVSSAKAAALIVEAWGNAPGIVLRRRRAVSLLVRHGTDSPWRTWGNAPGLVKSGLPALKARFTKNYLTHQRSFGKWINQPPHLSPLPASGARRSTLCNLRS